MKDIPGFEGLYAITDKGEVWAYPKTSYYNFGRWKDGRFLKSWLIGNGYKMVILYKEGIRKNFLVHRLVAMSFVPNPNGFNEVNHIDGDRLNNNFSNLEWVDSKSNKKHAWEKGLYNHKGSNHYLSRFTDKDIRKIRNIFNAGKMSQRSIARQYGVHQMTISHIVRYKTWKHVI